METIFDKALIVSVADIIRFIATGVILGFTMGLLVASTLKL